MHSQHQSTLVPEQFAGIHGLGSVRSVFRATTSNRWVSGVIGILLISVAGLASVYGIYDTVVQVIRYGPVMFLETIFAPFVLAILLFFPGALAIINAFLNWNKSIVVYDNGLGYSDFYGCQIWNWEDVEWFFVDITKNYILGIHTSTSHVYTLERSNKSKLKLNNDIEKVELLGRIIEQKVTPFQYGKLLHRIRSGKAVMLGKLSICKHNLAINKKIFSWSDVETVVIENGYANIKKRDGGWFSSARIPVSAIPNLDALFAILAQVVKVRTA